MSALEHFTLRLPAHTMPRASLEAVRLWWTRRRMRRIEGLAARQFASCSTHILSDIGVLAREFRQSPSLRLWTGGAT